MLKLLYPEKSAHHYQMQDFHNTLSLNNCTRLKAKLTHIFIVGKRFRVISRTSSVIFLTNAPPEGRQVLRPPHDRPRPFQGHPSNNNSGKTFTILTTTSDTITLLEPEQEPLQRDTRLNTSWYPKSRVGQQ